MATIEIEIHVPVQMQNSPPPTADTKAATPTEVTLLQDPEYRRLGCTIDFDAAYAKYNVFR